MFAHGVSEVDYKGSLKSDSSDDSKVVNLARKFVELLSKSAQSEEKKSPLKSSTRDSESEDRV